MVLLFGKRSYVMGIVNVTPDSFYDGGRYNDTDRAFLRAMSLLSDGADIIDIGGESSRPGAETVTVQEELDRVCPVIEKILKEVPTAFISVDTVKKEVADASCRAGARMINDISGISLDSGITEICVKYDAYLVIMHMRGTPQTMQNLTDYDDLIGEIIKTLQMSVGKAIYSGLSAERIILDPGIGFGKSLEQNYAIINHIPEFKKAGYPLLIGLSRKSLIGGVLGAGEDRLPATIALNAISVASGADIVRVHDVKEHVLSLRVVDMLRKVSDGRSD